MRIVGLMSGTSADAIDAVVVDLEGRSVGIDFKILYGTTFEFERSLQQRIHDAADISKSRIDEVCRLNRELGISFGNAVMDVLSEAGIAPESVALVGCSGQTIWHDVDATGEVNATLQIATSTEITQRTGITTISDLRTADVAVGGHGAPLTAYVDWLLLRHATKWRAIQNIGGMGNVTYLPPLTESHADPIAFDTGPGNALIDGIVQLLSDGKMAYDKDGEMAAAGQMAPSWLEELMVEDTYVHRAPPKTTGRELYGPYKVQQLIQAGRGRSLADNSIVATVTAFTAQTIAHSYQSFLPKQVDEVIIGGGGSRNPVLMQLLGSLLAPATVLTHEDIGMDSDLKEALVMAVLAYETWHMRPGNLPALTGAREQVVLGHITPGKNYIDLIRKTWCQQ